MEQWRTRDEAMGQHLVQHFITSAGLVTTDVTPCPWLGDCWRRDDQLIEHSTTSTTRSSSLTTHADNHPRSLI